MTPVSKNMYIDKLDHIVNKYNNIYHKTIKMKPVDVKPSTYIDSSKEINYQVPKFKIGDFVRISKYKNILQKAMFQIGLKKLLWLKQVKKNVPWAYVISDLKGKEIVGAFYEKEFQKANQKEFRAEKEIKRKGDKLYVKSKCDESYFNSWT